MATRRSIRGLVATWVGYWVIAGAIKLGPAIAAIWSATQAGDGKGTVSAGYGHGRFTLDVVNEGITTYSGSVTPLVLAAWVAGPPLLLWLAWALFSRKREPVSS